MILQPGDEAASSTRSTVGTTDDDAVGGFPKQRTRNLSITLTYTLSVNAVKDPAESCAGYVRLYYTTNGGSSWSTLNDGSDLEITFNDTKTDSVSATTTCSIGVVTDISQVQLRARAAITGLSGASTADVTAGFTDWEIAYNPLNRSMVMV